MVRIVVAVAVAAVAVTGVVAVNFVAGYWTGDLASGLTWVSGLKAVDCGFDFAGLVGLGPSLC